MASISSVNNTTGSSLTSSIRGFGGLASGLDRDTLIEQFTAGTRSKIAQQKQKQQKLQWTQEAIRGISDKIYDFSNKFTSFSSSSNLTSSKLFSRSQISVNGVNSKYVSATGSAASAENLSINRIKQLASNATMNTGEVSSKTLTTADLGLTGDKLDATKAVSTIAGDMLYVKYGNSTYGVTMADGGQDAASAVSMINEQLKTVEISGGKKLSDVMKAEVKDGKMQFTAIDNANGNRLELAGGTGDILKDLGFLKEGEKFDDLSDPQKNIAQAGGLTAANAAQVTKEEKLYNLLSEKKLTFSYNGTKGEIKLDKYDASTTLEKVKEDLQNKLNEAFGKGRISVDISNGGLSFTTTKPTEDGKTELDNSSTLSILSGAGLVGEGGVFGIAAGASNRINLSASVDKAGFKTADFSGSLKDDDSYYLSINGVEIEGITKDSTVKEIVEKINNSKAGVKVSYQSISDRFVITSTENGAAGSISFDGNEDSNLAALMFGTPQAGTNYTKGQDAVLSVSYPGSKDEIEITRASNSFDLDGINVTLKGTFGYDASGAEIKDTEAVTFTGSVDSENTTKTVKEMIEAFNDILKLVNTEVSTKPDRKYFPLTDEQKEEMSDKTIEKWEEKAKTGLLFADNDLRMMANSMRTVINAADRSKLSEMGITVSDSYSDNGKLVFDEAKFKAALEKDPEAVREVLNRPATDSGDTSQAGLLTRISSIMDRYGKTTGATKGVLVERAGSVHAPTSILKNSLQKQLDSIDTYIDKLNDKLKTEQDRYISQFTSLETLINQMNSQSSYLSSMFSY